MSTKWTITGESRTTAGQLILSALTERGIGCFDLCWLRSRIERHDWIAADDKRLGELAAFAGIELRLQPLPDLDD